MDLPEALDFAVYVRETGIVEILSQAGQAIRMTTAIMDMAQMNSSNQRTQPHKIVFGDHQLKLSLCCHVLDGRNGLSHSAPPVLREYWAARVIAPATSAKKARLRISLR